MNPSEFVAKWRHVELTERAASHTHFNDVCGLVGHPAPVEADPKGEWFAFERGVTKQRGGRGWADVWKKDCFGWEYKGKHKNLDAAYDQLLRYRENLENPPLLVVCDLDRIIIHTNFTRTVKKVHTIPLEEIGEPKNLEILGWLFNDPDKLKPGQTSEAVTIDAARELASVAEKIRDRVGDPAKVAHYLDRIVFCLFAERVNLLPDKLFRNIVAKSGLDPDRFARQVGQLFEAMAHGGDFGSDVIRHFNGNLFDDGAAIRLTAAEMAHIGSSARHDWGSVDPSIFGTLFEQGMDPTKRSQLGAFYTSVGDIETLIDPVVMQPLRREWAQAREGIEHILSADIHSSPAHESIEKARVGVQDFLDRLHKVRVLDPACGSGNFLYVALQKLQDLEKEVLVFANDHGIGGFQPLVGPWQLFGIEKNAGAFDLAQVTVWIGWLQWRRANGFRDVEEPVLRTLDNFRCMDAILDLSDPENPKEPEWPEADFIVGNPPFLGNKRMRSELGDDYCAALWKLYGDRIPAMTDLCGYWFEKARAAIEARTSRSAGLLATTGIRQVGSRRVLDRIEASSKIFFAISDRGWFDEKGAAVRICMVGFGRPEDSLPVVLDGRDVSVIHADLKSGSDLSGQQRLVENVGLCFMGTTKVGAFDIEENQARKLLCDANPHGRPNSDVLRPFRNGSDLVRVNSNRWIIDFGVGMPEDEAALYDGPFEYLVKQVKPERTQNARKSRAEKWWMLGETLPAFRRAVRGLHRYIATARVAKHRLFVWLDSVVLPDSKIIAIARDDDYSLGVLQSRLHEIWTLANCGWHGLGNDATYNPTTCFETFPFPKPTDKQRGAISDATRRLDELRSGHLIPPGSTREEVMEFPASIDGPWSRHVRDPDSRGIGVARYVRLVPRSSVEAKQFAKRTLTALYNDRPTWLEQAHEKLDTAVCAAYGLVPDLADEELLARLQPLNLERASTRPNNGEERAGNDPDS
jgi:hypothetical protein